MPKKTGSDVIGKKRIRRALDKANQIQIQMRVLEKLKETQMTSAELRQFIESLDGDYYLLLPILKGSGLVNFEEINTDKRGKYYVYSLRSM